MKKVLQVVVPLLLAIGLMWLVLKDTDFAAVGQKLTTINYWLMGLSMVPMIGAHLARSQRWRILLEPVGPKPTFGEAFAAVMVGYLANLALPRLGEVTRCTILHRRTGIPVEVAIGTVLAERAFDMVMLLVITLLSFTLEYDKLFLFFSKLLGNTPGQPDGSKAIGGLLIYLALFVVAAIALFYGFRKRITKLSFYAKVLKVITGLLAGILSAFKLKQRTQFFAMTAAIWVGYWLSTWLCLEAVPGLDTLGPLAGLLILTVGSFGMVAPVQGGYGPFEFMLIAGLTQFYNSDKITAETGALVTHNFQNIIVVAVGVISLLWLSATLGRHQIAKAAQTPTNI